MNQAAKILFALGKVRITFFVAITSALGYILSSGEADIKILIPVIGVFILSAGCSALNQYQEQLPDSLMERTKKRPIPSGLITSETGLWISLALISAGLGLLSLSNFIAFILGLFAIVWYNFIYTPLKKKTALAVVPGALIGAIPPLIGWVSGGGILTDPQIWALCLFFFVWQIPHFWLLLLIFDKDYEKGGFPTLTKIFSHEKLTRITYVWIVALVASCMLIPFFGMSKNLLINLLLFIAGFWLIWRTKKLLSQYENKRSIRFAFIDVNIYVLMVALLLSADKLMFLS